ncbi:hypothetical protein DdX_14225 [Ditylenchus destructor]|uniref:Uncharacterized protein n=1 Tax=Ditylenchus destructor TaxID=166010 RepID=A0AAD4MTS9_9BILA|nr:hypothetical protein DdX_14225 [Ditylenchus destructor]
MKFHLELFVFAFESLFVYLDLVPTACRYLALAEDVTTLAPTTGDPIITTTPNWWGSNTANQEPEDSVNVAGVGGGGIQRQQPATTGAPGATTATGGASTTSPVAVAQPTPANASPAPGATTVAPVNGTTLSPNATTAKSGATLVELRIWMLIALPAIHLCLKRSFIH